MRGAFWSAKQDQR